MAENFEHIGGRLRAARETAGLSVDDVIFRTQLPRSVVVALEAEDFSVFTSPLYARSFLAQYSGYLNVDAQPWIDALEPGGFMPGGLLRPIVEAPALTGVVRSAASETRGGSLSVLGLLALSAALVFAVMQSHDFFEARFGGESQPRAEVNPPAPPAPAMARRKVPAKIPAIMKEDEELGKPAPRAIIVR